MDIWLNINAGEQNRKKTSVRQRKIVPLLQVDVAEGWNTLSSHSPKFRHLENGSRSLCWCLKELLVTGHQKCIGKKMDILTLCSSSHIDLTPFKTHNMFPTSGPRCCFLGKLCTCLLTNTCLASAFQHLSISNGGNQVDASFMQTLWNIQPTCSAGSMAVGKSTTWSRKRNTSP